MPLDQKPHQTVTRCGCISFFMTTCGFSDSQIHNSACSHSHRGENELRQKRWFFGKNAHLQPCVVQPIGRTENASDGHAVSILALIELCTASPRSLFKILLKEVSEMFKFWERWRVDIDGCSHSEQQQQCFRLTLLDEHVNELLYPIRTLSNNPVWRIRFTNWSTNCVEGISFLPNFPRKFLTVWVEDSPLWK